MDSWSRVAENIFFLDSLGIINKAVMIIDHEIYWTSISISEFLNSNEGHLKSKFQTEMDKLNQSKYDFQKIR